MGVEPEGSFGGLLVRRGFGDLRRTFIGFIRHTLMKITGEEADYIILQVVCLLWRLWKNRFTMVFQFKQIRLDDLANQWLHQVKDVDQVLLISTSESRSGSATAQQVGLLWLLPDTMKPLLIHMFWKH
ncbi:unnamed protein product [Linum tenue]|uniref:Uncharacterized protein n=1 Tax=Linum tenue TaxID=586396 RepID=A0AAV0LEV9_9ROSI|nr:unnamed protein product [Linum tenue]